MKTTKRCRSTKGFGLFVLWALLLGGPGEGLAQTSPEAEAEVTAVVEAFLEAVGRYDVDALEAMFAPGASIGSAGLRNGSWVTRSQSADAWLAAIRSGPAREPFQEPASEFTVHIDDGQLAFVRADARLMRDGEVRSHNIDYFTLIRDGEGRWKVVSGSYTTKPAQNGPAGSTHLFVWAWDVDKGSDDFLAVVDVDRLSATYGQVVGTLPSEGARGAHHVEYELTTGRLFANAFATGRTFVFDVGDPLHPRRLADFTEAGAFAHPHSFARTPSETVLGTFQGRADDHDAVGGLVEMDDRGRPLRGSSAANPIDPDLRPYSLAVVPQLDRVVTTSADMDGRLVGRSVQVWRLSDLALLHTVLLPPGPRGDEHLHPAEPRVLADGKTVMVTTFRCGLYVLSGIDTTPVATLARSFPWSAVEGEDTDCNVPVRLDRFWVQPVGTTGSLVVLDLTDPLKPVIVDELGFGIDARPHWLALEPGGRRIVMTGGGTLAGGVYLVDIDPETGKLQLADDLPPTGSGIPGIRFDREDWPHGASGPAFAHGAVFSLVK